MLTPRRLRLGVDLFAGLVAASVGIALAGLVWRLAGDPGQRFGAAPVAARPRRPVDLAPLLAFAPFGAAAPVTALADQTLVLRGIMLASPVAASSALISVGGAAPAAFYAGQQVGGGTIETIAIDHIVLAGGGGRQILAFPDRGGGVPANGGSPPPLPPVSQPAIAPAVAPGPAAAAPNSAQMLAGLGVALASDGLHVTEATPTGRAVGLQPGDVVTRVNGAPAADLAQNPAAMQAALATGTAQIEVRRAGQRLTLGVGAR